MTIKNILLNACKKNLLFLFLLIISIIAIVVLQLVPPQILRIIVDEHLEKGVFEGISILAAIYLGAIVVSCLFELIKTILTAHIGQRAVLDMRVAMSGKLMRLPMRYFNKASSGDIMSRFTSDVEAINDAFSEGLVNMGINLFKILGLLLSILIMSRPLFIYTILALPIIVLLTKIFRKLVYTAQLQHRKIVGAQNSYLQEALSGLRIFKIFRYEDRISNALDPLLIKQIRIKRKAGMFESLFPCITQMLRAVIICLFIILSSDYIGLIAGVTIGTIAAAVDLLGRFFSPIEDLATEFQGIQQAFASFKRIDEFLALEEENKPEDIEADKDSQNEVIFSNVTFSYDNAKDVLHNVTLNISSGSKVALIGRTGSGKTTMLNLLAGLYPVNGKAKGINNAENTCLEANINSDENIAIEGSATNAENIGKIRIYGYDPYTMPAHVRRKIIGIVPQTVTTFTGKIMDLITLGDESISEENVVDALKLVGLYDDITLMPDGLHTIIGEGESNLSFGQMQLMTLARAIVTNPPILLLDELTSGLDAVTEAKILAAIKNVSVNRTIITISHRFSGILDADYIFVCADGRIIEEGSPNELVDSGGLYAKYKQIEDMGWQVG